ncbi:MAG: terpene cyclase/mutase family protein [Planctomycetes bacterium]|nr:terpene cyclase/mutase family protein [Planctomycetota bacterium]
MNLAKHPAAYRRITFRLAWAWLPLAWTPVAFGGPNLVANGDLNHTDQTADVRMGIGETAVYFTFDGAGDFGRVVARTDGSVSALKREMRVAYWEPSKAAGGGMRGLVIDTSEVTVRGDLQIEVWFDLKGKVRPTKQYEWSLVAIVPGGKAKVEDGFKVIAPAIWADGEPLGAEVDVAFNGYMTPRHGSTYVKNFERQTGSAGLVLQFPDNFKGQLVIVRVSLREVDEDLLAGREPVMPVPIRYVPIEDPLAYRIAEMLQKSSAYLRDQRDSETGAWEVGDEETSVSVTANAARALAAVGDHTDEGPLARSLDWLAEQLPEKLEEGEVDNREKRRERDFKQTATFADRLLCLARHGDLKNRKHQKAVAHDITWLEDAQFEDGGWATLHVDDDDAAALHSDNTSSARVVEALREAYFAGKPCERSVWVRASKYWVAAQASDGGFRGKMDQYGGVSQNTTVMRTAAGATSLLTTMDMAFAAGGNRCDQIQRNRAQVSAIRQALGWLDARYAPLTLDVLAYRTTIQWQLDQIVGESLAPFERLFYMQRVSEVSGRHLLGGEKHVLQEARLVLNYFYDRETGAFTGGPYYTALALATLSEVDAPTVLQRVVIGGDVLDAVSRDAEHMVRHLRRNRRRIMNWRDTTIDRPMRELTEVPILYLNVAGAVDWTEAQWSKIRDYCFAGGVVLIVFGLQMSGLVHIPYLDRTFQVPAP